MAIAVVGAQVLRKITYTEEGTSRRGGLDIRFYMNLKERHPKILKRQFRCVFSGM